MPDSRWKLISICTLCGEGDMAQKLGELIDKISIHALREEGDAADAARLSSISIHAFREEGNHIAPNSPRNAVISIHALREEDDAPVCRHTIAVLDFYPRPPRGGRPAGHCGPRRTIIISIHALREEGDLTPDGIFGEGTEFLSTPSARRATLRPYHPRSTRWYFYPRPPRGGRPTIRRCSRCQTPISIHALREEGDARFITATATPKNFYPRPPRGGRRTRRRFGAVTGQFLSTPSARRATLTAASGSSRPRNFYPRPPRGGRPHCMWIRACFLRFLSTPSARRATSASASTVPRAEISIHALREEGDHFLRRVSLTTR